MKSMQMKRRGFTLLLGILLTLCSNGAGAAQMPTPTPSASPSASPTATGEQKAEKDNDADKDYREMFNSLLDRATWFFGVIGGIVLLLGAVIFGLVKWTLKETREDAKKALQEEMNRRGLGELEHLQRQVAALNSFKDRRIDWFYPAGLPAPEKEKQFFVRMGLPADHIRLVPVASTTAPFTLKDSALVILSYDTSVKTSEEIKAISHSLVTRIVEELRSSPTPLLVYALSGCRLTDDELREIGKTSLYASANFPATVVTQALELIRLNPK